MKSQTLVDKYHWSPINAERSSIKDSFLADFVPVGVSGGDRYYINSKYVFIQIMHGFFICDTEYNLIEIYKQECHVICCGLHDISCFYIQLNENYERFCYRYDLTTGTKTQLAHSLLGGLFIEDGVIVPSKGKILKIGYDDTLIWEVELPNTADFANGLCYENSCLYYLTDGCKTRNCLNTVDGSMIFSFQLVDISKKYLSLNPSTINFVVNDLMIGWYYNPNKHLFANLISDVMHMFGFDMKSNSLKWEIVIPMFSVYSIYADCHYYSVYLDIETQKYYFMILDLSKGLIMKQVCIHDQIVYVHKTYETNEDFMEEIVLSGSCVSDEYFYFGVGTVCIALHKENLSVTKIFNNIGFKLRIANGVILVEPGPRLNILKEIPKVE